MQNNSMENSLSYRDASHHGCIDIDAVCGTANGLVEILRYMLASVNPADNEPNCHHGA